jgi:hypothetical protein
MSMPEGRWLACRRVARGGGLVAMLPAGSPFTHHRRLGWIPMAMDAVFIGEIERARSTSRD